MHCLACMEILSYVVLGQLLSGPLYSDIWYSEEPGMK